jgi:parallel beta-helix repeat protein
MKMRDRIMIISSLILLCTGLGYGRIIRVGHGPGYDYQTITEALAAGESGDEITVADGTYSTGTGEIFPLVMKAGVTPLRRENAFIQPIIQGNGANAVVYSDVNSVHVEGFTITGGVNGIYADGSQLMSISSCDFSGNITNGIYVGAQSSLSVNDCTFSSSNGISATNSVLSDVSNCTFTDCSSAGISAGNSHVVSVTGCDFSNSTGNGIYLVSQSSLSVSSCTFNSINCGVSSSGSTIDAITSSSFTNCASAAISADATEVNAVSNCDFSGNIANAIYLTNNSTLSVENSTFSSPGYGISAHNSMINVVQGCSFSNFLYAGINANGTAIEAMSDCLFSESAGNGILLSGQSSLRLEMPQSIFRNCAFGISSHDSSVWLAEDSVSCEDCEDALYIANSPVPIEMAGISLKNSSNNAIVFSASSESNYLRLSRCTLDGGGLGISMDRGAHLVIAGGSSGARTTINGFLNGIVLNEGCAAEISLTDLTGCRGNALYIDRASNVSLEDCLFQNNTNQSPYRANKAFCLSASSVTSLTIGRCTFKDSDKAVYVRNGTNLLVDGCTFNNCRYFEGVGIHDTSTGTVRDSEFYQCLAGVSVQNGARAWIYNNQIKNSAKMEEFVGPSTPFGQGLFVEDSSIADIVDNVITDCDNEGIYLNDSAGSVVHNYIYNNGHVAQDGNGVFCHNSEFVVMDNYICNNFLNGVSVADSPSWIYQNDIRHNNRGGIKLANTTAEARFNLCYQNDKIADPGFTPKEVWVGKAGSAAIVADNTLTDNRYAGIGIEQNGYARVVGNLIVNNAQYNANLFNTTRSPDEINASFEGNVIDGSEQGVFLNTSYVDYAHSNHVTNATIKCADIINAPDCQDFRYNWWGHSSGPRSSSCNCQNAEGQGCVAENVDCSPWLTQPFAYYYISDAIAMGQGESRILESSDVPPVRMYVRAKRALSDEIFSVYLSYGVDIFPDYPYSGEGQIGNGIYLCLNASYGLRNWLEACEIRIYPDYTFGAIPVSTLRLKRFNIKTGIWEMMPAFYNPSLGCLVVRVGDPQGAYVIVEDASWQIGYEFTMDREGWTTGSAPAAFSIPDFVWEPDFVKITSRTNTNTFGFWQSSQDAIPAEPGYLYRARFNVSTTVADQRLVPWIRVRSNSASLQQYDSLSIESAGDGGASPGAIGTNYDLYFVPPSNDTGVILAFDLLNFNPDDAGEAELLLERLTVDRISLESLAPGSLVRDYTFDLGTDGWSTGGVPTVYSVPEYIQSDGVIGLRALTNTNTFGYWGNNPADITLEAERLYRATFDVHTDVANRALVPEARLRFNVGNLQASQTLGIVSTGNGANSPGIENTTYDWLYFLPPANCVGQPLIVSFDILNFNPDDSPIASLILDRVVIETLSIPSFP